MIFKRIFTPFFFFFLSLNTAFANPGPGELFTVSSTGTSGDLISITLCLNIHGKSPLSCQNYQIYAGSLSLSVNTLKPSYSYAGIRINTPGYTFSPVTGTGAKGFFDLPILSSTPVVVGVVSNALTAAPTVTGISPPSGSTLGGTSVTITGTNLTGATAVTIGGLAATAVTVVNSTSITATTPAGTAGTASVLVTTPGGTNVANTLFTYTRAPQETLNAVATPSSIISGGISNLSTTGGSGSGTVTYSVVSGGTSCSISGATLTGLAGGQCTLTATKAADSSYTAATSLPITVTVTLAPTFTILSSSENPSLPTDDVIFTATVSSSNGVGSPSGNVNFESNGASLPGCDAKPLSSGVATCSVSIYAFQVQPYSVVASYGADTSFGSSQSSPFSQYVTDPAITPRVTTVPAAPTDVTVVPGNEQVVVSWFPPANTGGLVISSYVVKYGITPATSTTTAGCTSSPCTISNLTNTSSYTVTVAATNSVGTGPAAYSSPVTPTEGPLIVSTPTLALSVNAPSINTALTGNPRTITIRNAGVSSQTLGIITVSPAFTGGTTISSDNCSGQTLDAGTGQCTITVTPGATASLDINSDACSTGTIPAPNVITVPYGDSSLVTANVVVLGYGCQYQQGYVFAVDDTTPLTSSVGGKVVSLLDNGPSVTWSADTVSIWGIDETSTVGVPSPNASTPVGQTATLATGQINCNGNNDGSCDTNNIVIHYPMSLISSPLPTNNAALVCKQTSNGLSDWYLPSICEMGYYSVGDDTGCGSSPGNYQNIQFNLVSNSLLTLTGNYWSSTEYSGSPLNYAWQQFFARDTSSQLAHPKSDLYSVRCSRLLTS